MNTETVAGLTAALIEYQREQGVDSPTVVVARDIRPSSRRLAAAAVQGALYADAEPLDIGVAPTPTAQFVAGQTEALATVVITASHNPAADNGWKGMLGNFKPNADQAADISRRYWDLADNGFRVGGQLPKSGEQPAWQRSYTRAVVHDIQSEFGDRPLADTLFVVDGAYGAGQQLTPTILRRLGAEVVTFACDGQGIINDGVGAANLAGLKTFLTEHPEIVNHPDFVGAVANDGDADRLMGVGLAEINGERQLVEVTGNHAMWAMAEGQPGIIGTEYTNSGLVRRLQQAQIGFGYCPNGDVNVTNRLGELQAEGFAWTRGGEFTGHHIMTDWLPSGDGVRMAAWLASWAASHGKTFGDLYRELPLWPEIMHGLKVPPAVMKAARHDDVIQTAIRDTQGMLGDEGRLVVRPSGTEPIFRLWGEAPERGRLERLTAELGHIIQRRLAVLDN